MLWLLHVIAHPHSFFAKTHTSSSKSPFQHSQNSKQPVLAATLRSQALLVVICFASRIHSARKPPQVPSSLATVTTLCSSRVGDDYHKTSTRPHTLTHPHTRARCVGLHSRAGLRRAQALLHFFGAHPRDTRGKSLLRARGRCLCLTYTENSRSKLLTTTMSTQTILEVTQRYTHKMATAAEGTAPSRTPTRQRWKNKMVDRVIRTEQNAAMFGGEADEPLHACYRHGWVGKNRVHA
jgi:hypothetical protein